MMNILAIMMALLVSLQLLVLGLQGTLYLSAKAASFGPRTHPVVGYFRYACAALMLIVGVHANVAVSWKVASLVYVGFSR